MKKFLIASTAVAALGLSAGAASASEKIKLDLGGFSHWWVVGQWQDNSFQSAAQADYNSVDVKGDNEVYFRGSTTLDNGMKIGVDIQLEAGGGVDGTTDPIDESYVYVEGGFGKAIIGTKNNGAYLLHNTAPDAAGNWNEWGIMTGGNAVAKPASVRTITPTNQNIGNTTAIVTDDDADKITYVAPAFYGLTVGASYVPNTKEDDRGATNLNSTSPSVAAGEIYGVGALYANTFGGVGIKVSGGFVTYDLNGAGTGGSKNGVNEYSTGAQVSYAGFTLGGSFRKVSPDNGAKQFDGYAYDAGLMYSSGPYAVSLSYFKSQVEGTNTTDGKDDKIEFIQVSGKYNIGAGVNLLASAGHAKYEDETGLAANENEGWTVMTGLSLDF